AAPRGRPGRRGSHPGRATADALGGYRRKVGGGDVGGDLLDRLEGVLAEILGVVADDLLGRRLVDAVREHGSVVVHHDVAVLPDDLRVAVLDRLAGSAPDLGHLVFADVELPNDQVSRHEASFSACRLDVLVDV